MSTTKAALAVTSILSLGLSVAHLALAAKPLEKDIHTAIKVGGKVTNITIAASVGADAPANPTAVEIDENDAFLVGANVVSFVETFFSDDQQVLTFWYPVTETVPPQGDQGPTSQTFYFALTVTASKP